MNFGLNFRQNLGNSRLDCGYQAAAAADKAGRQTEGALLYLAAADSIARVAADPKESKKKKQGLAKKMPVSCSGQNCLLVSDKSLEWKLVLFV